MNGSLIAMLALSGLAGSGHCVLMCGSASAAIAPLAGSDGSLRALSLLQTGRVLGYALLGGLAASVGTGLFDAMTLTQAVRPLWVISNLLAVLIGASLLIQARQPGWLDQIGQRIGANTRWAKDSGQQPRSDVQPLRFYRRHARSRSTLRLLASGVLWAAVPCGLLYSAVILVMISATPGEGAMAMAGFAVASALPLLAVQKFVAVAAQRSTAAQPAVGVPPNTPVWARNWQALGARAFGLLMLSAGGYGVYSVALGDAGRLLCRS